jgi:hypothetical protein
MPLGHATPKKKALFLILVRNLECYNSLKMAPGSLNSVIVMLFQHSTRENIVSNQHCHGFFFVINLSYVI